MDKFASLPWVGESGALLGGADRYDAHGFHGAAEPRRGARLAHPLLPPDLVIQDELHLISGPLGTMAGLYETVIEALCAREIGGRRVKPKIVASTATVRHAREQIRALFARPATHVFPPPGPERRDSFFARTAPASRTHARRYFGVAAQGRNPKEAMRRVVLALMGAAERAWRDGGGTRNRDNPADPYMTVLGYFNSLRELGGARRILEEEVQNTLKRYGERRRLDEGVSEEGLFRDRTSFSDMVELTSRVGTGKRSDSGPESGSGSGARPGARSRRLVPRTALTNGRYEKKPVVATRFVRACSRGHVDDIDWYRFVHARKGLAPRPSPPGAPGVPRPPPAPSRFRATARLHPQGISARAPASKFSPTPLQSIPPAACSRADSSSAASGGSTR